MSDPGFHMCRRVLAAAVVCIVVTGAGCLPTLAENPPRDARSALPDRFSPDEETLAQASIGTKDWRDYFASPALQGLVDEALHNNQELNIQLQELVIGRAEVDARYGELFPKVGASVGAGIEKVGGNTSQGAADRLTGCPSTCRTSVSVCTRRGRSTSGASCATPPAPPMRAIAPACRPDTS